MYICKSDIMEMVIGFCLEKIPVKVASKYKRADRTNRIVNSLEKAGDLALLYFQEGEKLFGSSPSINTSAIDATENFGELLSNAIQKVPLLYMKHGYLQSVL